MPVDLCDKNTFYVFYPILFTFGDVTLHEIMASRKRSKQLLQLCAARRVWFDAVIKPARLGPFREMYYPNIDPVNGLCMIYRHT